MTTGALRAAPLGLALLGAAAHAAVVQVDESAFSGFELRFGFEEFTPNSDVVETQLERLGVRFSSTSNGGVPVEPYSDYSTELVDFALGAGAGANGLIHDNDGEAIEFDPPVTRVGFLFGSNVPVDVPITVSRGGVGTSFHLVVAEDQLEFFGFEDPQGIDEIGFGTELNGPSSSQIDELRFEWDPGGSVTRIGPGAFSGSEAVLGFESFTPDVDIVSDQFSGVTFFNQTDGGWPVESYSGYSDALVDFALGAGAGANGLIHGNAGEEIRFDPPVTRVGFLFGSNIDVRVPVTLSRDGVPTGSMPIVVPANTLRLFAFEDAGGIDEIGFATELNDVFVSQLDQLRFETVPEPSGAILAATGAAVLAARARRRRRPGA